MIEAEETLAVLSALGEGATSARLTEMFGRPELKRVFPAVGVPTGLGLEYLEAFHDPVRRERLDETGRLVVAYFRALVHRRAELEALLRGFREIELSLTADAFERTREFLPDSCDLGEIRFVLLPIGLDFRTERQTVYMDPLAALQYGLDGIRRTLAHEFHHVARYRLTGVDLTLMRPEEERPPRSVSETFRDWATWLEAEGVADCVSKATDVEIPALAEALERRRHEMAEYSDLLRASLEHVRDALTKGEPREPELLSLRRELRSRAHPVGFRMAERIVAEDGRTALVDCVGDPALFVERYSDLARETESVPFDEDLIRLLRDR